MGKKKSQVATEREFGAGIGAAQLPQRASFSGFCRTLPTPEAILFQKIKTKKIIFNNPTKTQKKNKILRVRSMPQTQNTKNPQLFEENDARVPLCAGWLGLVRLDMGLILVGPMRP